MTEPIQLESELSDERVKKDYPALFATMNEQLELTVDRKISGVYLKDDVIEMLAVAATHVAVEVCSHCREQRVPCNCMRDD